MTEYVPRQYWADRARREGKKYVAYKNRESAFRDQVVAFCAELDTWLPRSGTLLDFGCGVGRFATFATQLVDKYEGVDITEEALTYVPYVEHATFTHLDEDKLPFPDNHFDGAMALTVLQHIVSPEDFALWTAELARVVKPGGYFFVIDTPAPEKLVKRGYHMMWRTPEEIAMALGATLQACSDVNAEFKKSHYAFLATKDK